MKIDQVISLANGKRYLLLLNSELQEDIYFLAVGIDDNDEPTKEYVVLKEIKKDGEVYSQRINNPILINQLIADYQNQFDDEYGA